MSSDALRPIEEFLKEQNDPTELISFKQLRQADLHSIVARQAIGESVKLTVLLHEWGKVTGTISGILRHGRFARHRNLASIWTGSLYS
jgi:hypothetical protein